MKNKAKGFKIIIKLNHDEIIYTTTVYNNKIKKNK